MTEPNTGEHRNPFLIDAVELAAILEEPGVRVVDASWYLPAQARDARAEYLQRRVPGSVFFDIDAIVDGSSGLPHTLASPEAFAAAVGALGIGDGDRIVVLDGSGLFSAARVWWNFRWLGAGDVRILDGGLPAWERAGLPLESGEPAAPRPAVFTPHPDAERLADLDTVRHRLADGTAVVLDVRPAERFEGRAPEPREGVRAGHMPGAVNLPFTELVQEGGLRDVATLQQLFQHAGIGQGDTVIASCGSGVTAAIALLALESIGHRHHALYDGSWAEWGAHADTDVATGTARPGNDTIDRLLSHRSIRVFSERAVDQDTVRTLVACGQAAATSSNVQATTVIQVDDADARAELARLAGHQRYVQSAPVFLVWCADLKRSSEACARVGGTFEPGMTEHFLIATVDVALAAQNAVVAAESLGLGVCYIGGLRNAPAEVAELLALPDQVYPVFGLCVGWPDQDPQVKPRLPLDAVLMQERYDASVLAARVAEYDETLLAYYAARSTNSKVSDWSGAMRALVGKESRPWMREFLAKRGFTMR